MYAGMKTRAAVGQGLVSYRDTERETRVILMKTDGALRHEVLRMYAVCQAPGSRIASVATLAEPALCELLMVVIAERRLGVRSGLEGAPFPMEV